MPRRHRDSRSELAALRHCANLAPKSGAQPLGKRTACPRRANSPSRMPRSDGSGSIRRVDDALSAEGSAATRDGPATARTIRRLVGPSGRQRHTRGTVHRAKPRTDSVRMEGALRITPAAMVVLCGGRRVCQHKQNHATTQLGTPAGTGSSPSGISSGVGPPHRPNRSEQLVECRLGSMARAGRVRVQVEEELAVGKARSERVTTLHGEGRLADAEHPVDRLRTTARGGEQSSSRRCDPRSRADRRQRCMAASETPPERRGIGPARRTAVQPGPNQDQDPKPVSARSNGRQVCRQCVGLADR